MALISANREARGHGLWVDAASLDAFRGLLAGRPLKAYATHGSFGRDGTLDEIGLWTRAELGGDGVLRATFSALKAWREHRPGEFDTLFELAEVAPSEFGVSLNFRFNAAWVTASGAELPTRRMFGAAGWSYEPSAPQGATRPLPSVRPTEVFSADFVDRPAANDGLFSAAQFGVETRTPHLAVAELRGKLNAVTGSSPEAARLRGRLVRAIRELEGQR